jgi:hypothetical protein
MFNFSVPPTGSSQPRSLMSFDFSIPPAGTGSAPSQHASPSPLHSSSPDIPSFRHARSPDSSSRQPQIDPCLLADELSALFVDALANQFSFGDTEQDLRKSLHGFARVCQFFSYAYSDETVALQLGHGLSKPDLATRTYLLGGVFCVLKEQRVIAASHLSTQHLLADLQIRLEATFSLSPEQRVSNLPALFPIRSLKQCIDEYTNCCKRPHL